MSQVINFYTGKENNSGYSYNDVVYEWDNQKWEDTHDFIQWLFPLDEPSKYNADAPILNESELATFQSSQMLRHRLILAYERFLSTLGLRFRYTEDEGLEVFKTRDFDKYEHLWKTPNHNWLRVTRVMKTLNLVGLSEHSTALYYTLKQMSDDGYNIPEETLGYWFHASY